MATELNLQLSRFCLPSDAFGVIGISWTDLFPNDKENFVLGKADAEHHSAVVSFGRFDTNQSDQHAAYADISRVDGDLIWKMIKVSSSVYCSHCGKCFDDSKFSSRIVEAVCMHSFLMVFSIHVSN